MGIPGFYKNWLKQKVPNSIGREIPDFVSSLAFDLNGVFHQARKTVYGEENKDPRFQQALTETDPNALELEMQSTIIAIISNMIQLVKPRDCLILTVDGVAPGAKMQQQRGRREKSARESKGVQLFDKNAITPGTEFMTRLNTYIIRFIANYRDSLPPKVIYSSHLVPGEGEHKIMDYYRRGEVSDGIISRQGGCHILYGLDADLIMLSLLAPIDNIYLSRESRTDVVNINSVKEYLLENGHRSTAIDDFVVMMFLMGNDFLPHIPSLEEMSESIALLLDIYAAGNYSLTKINDNRHSIDWDGMKTFMNEVAAHENDLLLSSATATTKSKFESKFLSGSWLKGRFYPDVFRTLWYKNALGPKGPKPFNDALLQIINTYVPTQNDYLINSKSAQYNIIEISPVTSDRIDTMVFDYMRIMEWIYLYYREGTNAINQDLAYPYYHTPMLVDLNRIIQNNSKQIYGYQAYEGMTSFNVLQQLLAVLPIKSKSLLPQELQQLLSYNSIIRDLYPEDFILELDGKNFESQGIPIIPLIDRQRIIDAIATIPFTPERLKQWLPSTEEFFVRTIEENEQLALMKYAREQHEKFLQKRSERIERSKNRQQSNNLVPTMTESQNKSNPPYQNNRQRPNIQGQRSNTQGQRSNTQGQRSNTQGQRQYSNVYPGASRQNNDYRKSRGTFVQRAPPNISSSSNVGSILNSPGVQINKDAALTPVETTLPQNIQIGKGPSLTQIGTTLPQNIQIGKIPSLTQIRTTVPQNIQIGNGPSLTQVGTSLPQNIQIGKMPSLTQMGNVSAPISKVEAIAPQIIPVNKVNNNQVRSPAQWKQMDNLM